MISHRTLILFFFLSSTTYQTAQEKNEKLFCHTLRQDATTQQTAQPSMLVLNYALRSTAEESLQSFRNHKLSTHYIIDKDGKLYKGMSEQLEEVTTIDPEFIAQRAFHTGIGYWNGDKEEINNINTHSIGILFVNEGATPTSNPDYIIGNPENTTQWYPYSSEQIESFVNLTKQLKATYNIADKDIVGYHEVRTNNAILNAGGGPGPLFPWRQAAQQGVGLTHTLTEEELSSPCATSIEALQQGLHAWGYSVKINGEKDTQTTQAIKQLQIHHDSFYHNPDNQQNICRASHIVKNLLAQHYAQKQAASK
jgi:N-acetyl-anhydromuramyl-L-alanine amidase AmpD